MDSKEAFRMARRPHATRRAPGDDAMTPPLWYALLLSVALSTAAAGWAALACWGVAALARRGRVTP